MRGRREIEAMTVWGAKVASWEAHSDCQTVNYVSSEVGRGKIGTGLEWSHVPSSCVSGLATQQSRDGDGSGKGKALQGDQRGATGTLGLSCHPRRHRWAWSQRWIGDFHFL